jgi:hypothetical protein
LHVRIPTTSYRDLWPAVLLPSPFGLPPSPHLALPWPSPRLACTPNLLPLQLASLHTQRACACTLTVLRLSIECRRAHPWSHTPFPQPRTPTTITTSSPIRPLPIHLSTAPIVQALFSYLSSSPSVQSLTFNYVIDNSLGFPPVASRDPNRSASPSHQASTRPPSSYISDGTTGDIVQPSGSPCTLLILKHFAAQRSTRTSLF